MVLCKLIIGGLINCERVHSTVFSYHVRPVEAISIAHIIRHQAQRPTTVANTTNIFNLPLSFAIHHTKETEKSHI